MAGVDDSVKQIPKLVIVFAGEVDESARNTHKAFLAQAENICDIETNKIMSGVAPRTSPSRLTFFTHFLIREAQAGLLLADSRRPQTTYATDE